MPTDYDKLPDIFDNAKYFIKKLNLKVKNKNKISYVSINRFLLILENKDFEKKKEIIYENFYPYNLKINPTTLHY